MGPEEVQAGGSVELSHVEHRHNITHNTQSGWKKPAV